MFETKYICCNCCLPVKEYLLEKTERGKIVVPEKKSGAGGSWCEPVVLAVYN